MALIFNARLYTGGASPRLIENGAIYYEGDTIVEVGKSDHLCQKYNNAKGLDAQNMLLMPGFICAHGHFYGMFARGMGLKDEPPTTFKEILERLWWRLDLALEEEDNYLSAMVCLIQAIKCGTTSIVDHHASPKTIKGSLDTVARATKQAGVRACLCYEVTDRNGPEGMRAGVEENIRFIKRCFEHPDPLLGATFGLHASFTVSDDTLKECVQAMDGVTLPGAKEKTGFHIHVAEGPEDCKDSLKKNGKRTIIRLRDAGILREGTLAVHCVDCDEEEIDAVAASGAFVIHNPESNMNNAVGVSDVLKMMEKKITVGLGTDGMTMDMWQESKVNYLLHKLNRADPRVMGGETLKMLHENNSIIASHYFQKPVGVLEAGNFPWHMQFGMSSDMVDTTIVGGTVLMQGRELKTVNEAEIMAQSRARAPGVWDRF